MKLECNIDEDPTVLFQMIEESAWVHVVQRLKTNPAEAKTWMCRFEEDNSDRLRWRMLPLHLAVIVSAPTDVIEEFLHTYKDASKCIDDNGMLPIHLAVKKHANKDTINLLLGANPNSIDQKNYDGQTPLEMAQRSSSPHRDYYQRVLKRGRTHSAVTSNPMSELMCGVNLNQVFNNFASLPSLKNGISRTKKVQRV